MLKNEKTTVKTSNKNISHYKKIYGDIKSGDTIEITTDQLPYSSKNKVNVYCDICNSENEISIFSYRRNIKEYNYYSCQKCSNIKAKETSISIYGVDSFSKTFESKKKTKETKKRTDAEKNKNIEYEKDFLDKYYNIGLDRGPTVRYMFNEIEHFYYSDFYYEKLNLIIEIKSTKWYEEHLYKNLEKQRACRDQGYNFIFIIDKNYDIFDTLIKHEKYDKNHCWQYDLRLNTYDNDIVMLNSFNINSQELKIRDFTFEYIDNENKNMCKNVKKFIEKYEWLGKMPNRPTHRFIAKYNGILAGVIVMATPNSFSTYLGQTTKDIEKLISRGACASWTPKNLASSLLMWSIKWMVKNTKFRLFSAYSDTEAKEIGTIYQACNFYYIGQNFGSDKLFFDLNTPNIGWSSGRNFRKRSSYKKIAKENNIIWKDEWTKNYSIIWDNIPIDIKNILIDKTKEKINNCLVRKTIKKHKYIYILGADNRETKKLRKIFLDNNNIYNYPKR